uniref:Kinesin motor domain-containing protein n=1 Tax=Eutreptiella gymnastica TaxID=73025 RepID=A0A7S4G806_9EUGL
MPSKSRASVQVLVRCRPFNAREEAEGEKGCTQVMQVQGNTVRMFNPKKDMEAVREEFVFDHCFDSTRNGRNDQQIDVYQKLGPQILDNCTSGYNACLFAYGQTGSGKTHTMLGNIDDPEARGVIPRLMDELFERIEAKKQEAGVATFKLEATYMEIYCEKVKDLLVKSSDDLKVRSTPDKGVFVEGLTSRKVESSAEIYKLLSVGAKNRAVAATAMNKDSSRSHAIFTLVYQETSFASSGDHKVQTRSKTSHMYLVDLAGSERVEKTGVSGSGLEEAKKINQSLTTLGRIIDMLANRKPGTKCPLPVRESTLTWLLGDSLGGNSKTIMLAAISPSASSYDETINTLRYAARTKCIVNEASVNETVDMKLMDELRGQIDELQGMLKSQNDLRGQLQTNEEKMQALEQMLEQERLAKEKSDAELRERAEKEKQDLMEKLQLEKEQVEEYLSKERQELQGKIAEQDETIAQYGREKQLLKEQFERALRDLTNQTMREKQELQEKCNSVSQHATKLETMAADQEKAHASEKSTLEAQIEDLNKKLTGVQQDLSFQQQRWQQEKELFDQKVAFSTQRAGDIESDLQKKIAQLAKAREELEAHHEAELAKTDNARKAKIAELKEDHEQAVKAMQQLNDERFQALKAEMQQQHDASKQRASEQQEAAAKERENTEATYKGKIAELKAEIQQQQDTNNQRTLEQQEAAAKERDTLKAQIAKLKQEYEQELEAKQKQGHEKSQQLEADMQQRHAAEKERLLEQHEAALGAVKQQHAEECGRLKQAHQASTDELQSVKSALEATEADCSKAKQLHAQAHKQLCADRQSHDEETEKLKGKYAQDVELAKKHYEEEVQRVLQQQAEAVKDAQKKGESAVIDAKKKFAEELEKQKKDQKKAHDETLAALQGKIDTRWEHQRQEHNRDLESQRRQHALQVESLEAALADAQGQLASVQEEADRTNDMSKAYIRDYQLKYQNLERKHTDEMGNLAQIITTLQRLLHKQLDESKRTENELKAHQRRLETTRTSAAKDAQDLLQLMPQEIQFALQLKSPRVDSTPKKPDSPFFLRRNTSLLDSGSPLKSPNMTPKSPMMTPPQKDGIVSPTGLLRHGAEDIGSPDILRTYNKLNPSGTPTSQQRTLKSPSSYHEEEEDSLDNTMGSFNAGDSSLDTHPDEVTRTEFSLNLF